MSMDIIHQTINNQTALDDFLFVHDDLLLGLSCIPPIFWGVSPPKEIRNEPKKKTNNNTHPKTAPKLLEREFLDSTLSWAEPSVKSKIANLPTPPGVFVGLGDLETFRQNTESTKNPSLPNRNPNLQFFCAEILGGLGRNMWKVSRFDYLFLRCFFITYTII